MISGDYYFYDDLKYETSDWKYCDGEDRRYYPEHLRGIKPVGATQMTKEEDKPNDIPEGTYGFLFCNAILKRFFFRCWGGLL